MAESRSETEAEKTTVEERERVISDLKEKLTEAMETLKKNSETIEFLN